MLNKEDAFEVRVKKYNTHSYAKTWYFKCECGETFCSQSTHLKTHSGKCRKCCQRGKPYEAIYNEMVRARGIKNKDGELTYEQFLEVINSKECHYCKTPMHWFPHTKAKGHEIPGARAYQIDRKYNEIGYLKENCVPCCWTCNRLKSDVFTYEEFLEIGLLIQKFRKNRKELNMKDFSTKSHSEKFIENEEKERKNS